MVFPLISNNTVLFKKSGVPAFDVNCCVCNLTPCICRGIDINCVPCAFMPDRWQFVMNGVTNGTCTKCNKYNSLASLGTNPWYLCIASPSTCVWETPTGSYGKAACASSNTISFYRFRVALGDGATCGNAGLFYWILEALSGTAPTATVIARWQLSVASVACCTPNVLTLCKSTGDCANWPSTISLVPCVPTNLCNFCGLTPDARCGYATTTGQVLNPPTPNLADFCCDPLQGAAGVDLNRSSTNYCQWSNTVTCGSTGVWTHTVTVTATHIYASITITGSAPPSVSWTVNYSKAITPPIACREGTPHTLTFDSESGSTNPCTQAPTSWSSSSYRWNQTLP